MANYLKIKTIYFASVLWIISGISIETSTTFYFGDTTTEFPSNSATVSQLNTTTLLLSSTISTFPINASTTFPFSTTSTFPFNTTTHFPIDATTSLPFNTTTTFPFNSTTTFPFNSTTTFSFSATTAFPINTTTTFPFSSTTTFPLSATTTYPFNTTSFSPSHSPTVSATQYMTFYSNTTTTVSSATSDLHEITTTETPVNTTTESSVNSTTETPVNSTTESSNNSTTETPVNTTTASPVNSTTETPVNSTTESSVNSTTETPVNTTTASPVNSTTESPVNSTTETPVNTTTETPVNSTTDTPVNTTTETPVNSTTETPVNTTNESPVNSTTESPVNSTTETRVNSTTESPVNSNTETPVNITTETPVNSTTETSVNTTTETPVNTTTERRVNTTTESPVNSITESPVNSTTETTVNTTTETPVNSTTESPVNSTTETPVNTTTETPVNSTTETPVNTTTETPVNSTTETPVNTTTESSVNSTTESPVDSTTETRVNSTTESPVNTTTASLVNNTTISPVNTTTESPVTETTESPVNETTESPFTETTESPVNETTESPVTETTESPFIETTESPVNETTESPVNETTESPFNETTESPVNETTESPVNVTTESPSTETTESPVNETTESPFTETTESPFTETTESSVTETTESPVNETTESPVNETTESPVTETTESPFTETTESPVNETTESPVNETTESPVTETTESPVTETTESPVNETTESPVTETTESPVNETTESPFNETTESSVTETTESPVTETTESPVNETTKSPFTETTESPVNETTESPVNETTESPFIETTESPVNETTELPFNETTESSVTETTESPVTETTESPVNETTKSPFTETTESPVNETTESPVNETTESPFIETTESPVNETTESPVTETTESPFIETTESPVTETTKSPVNETTESPFTETTESPVNETTESPVNETTESPFTETTESPVNETTESPFTETTESPVTETTESPVTETTESPVTETTESPVNETTESPFNETTESPFTETTESQFNETTELPFTETTESPVNETTELPFNETTELPFTETTESPVNETTESPVNETTESPVNETTELPFTETTESPVTETTESPVNETTQRTTDENTVTCLQTVDSQQTTWYTTVAGETRTVDCDEGYSGVKTRFCSTSGKWELPRYDCLRQSIQDLNSQSSSLDLSSSDDDIAEILSDALNQAADHGEKLTERDISALVEALDKISTVLLNMNSFTNGSIVQTFTDLVSSIIDSSNEQTWESLSNEENASGEVVLQSMNRIVEVVGRSLNDFTSPNSDSFHITSDNLDFKVERAVGDTIIYPNPTELNSDWLMQSGSELTFNLTSLPENDGQYTVAAMSFKDMSSILPLSSTEQELNGQIMSFSTFPPITEKLAMPISLTFHQNSDLLTKPSCTYWEFDSDTGGGWSTDGCTVAETSPSSTVCTCTHLTDFAIVLSLQDCGEPIQPTNGFVYYDSTTYRTIAEYVCQPGYALSGNQSTECLYNGSWSLGSTACTQIEEEIKLCPRDTDARGSVWLETQAGNTREKNCQTGYTGNIIRQCNNDGTWRSPQYNCIREKVQEIQEKVADVSENTTEEDLRQTVADIRNITELTYKNTDTTEEKLTDGEIFVLSSSLDRIGSLVQDDTAFVTDVVVDDFVESASNLIDKTNADSWKSLRESDSTGAENLLTAVTSLVEAVGQTLNGTEKKTVVKKNLAVEAQKYTNTDVVFPVPQQIDVEAKDLEWVKETRSQIQLETESLQSKIDEDKSISYVITMVMYKDIAEILPSSAIHNKTTSSVSDYDENQINGPILAMSISPKENTPTIFDPPISIIFEHFEGNLSSPLCSFWRFNNGSQGAWSSDGCWVNSTNETITVCQCNHLTNFAILMSPFKEMDSTSTVLRIISIVGIGISICCVIITLLVHICLWRHVRNDRTTILMNLCVALLFAYIIFLSGVDRTESKTICAVIAGFLQYLYLVVFCVMLVEGIEVAIAVLYVFKTKSRIKLLLVSAWVLPGIIVAISAGVTQGDGYGSDLFCWLSVDSGLIWSFVGPALVIIFFNVICICVVMRAMCNTATMKTKNAQDKVRASVRSLCVLVPVMGISWLLGIFYVEDGFIFVQFIFTILNGLQGLFIFIFHCLLNKQVKNALKLKKRRRSAQETFQSSSKNSPRKNKLAINSKETNSYVDEAGDYSRSSDNQIHQDMTRQLLQPQMKMTGAKYNSPMSGYANGTLRPAATFSSRSRDHMSSDVNSSNDVTS